VAGIVSSLRDAKQTGWPGVCVRGREGGREREERGTMHVCERVCAWESVRERQSARTHARKRACVRESVGLRFTHICARAPRESEETYSEYEWDSEWIWKKITVNLRWGDSLWIWIGFAVNIKKNSQQIWRKFYSEYEGNFTVNIKENLHWIWKKIHCEYERKFTVNIKENS